MTYAKLLLALVSLFGSITAFLRERGLISAGEATAVADALEAQANDIDKGRQARLDQRARDAGGVPVDQDDPFLRD